MSDEPKKQYQAVITNEHGQKLYSKTFKVEVAAARVADKYSAFKGYTTEVVTTIEDVKDEGR